MSAKTLAVAILALAAATASAQPSGPESKPELRIDATSGRPSAVHLLPGVILPMGNYVRLTLAAGGGAARSRERAVVGSGRAELLTRFLLDPYHESRFGLSAGGGITVRHEPETGTRAYLAMLVDLELPATGSWVPALQVGLGGGARIAVVGRRAQIARR